MFCQLWKCFYLSKISKQLPLSLFFGRMWQRPLVFNSFFLITHAVCRYWLSVGAQPSEPVQRILFRAGVLPPPPVMAMGRKGGPRDTRPVDPMTGRILNLEKPLNADQAKDSEGDVYGEEGASTSWNSSLQFLRFSSYTCLFYLFLGGGGYPGSQESLFLLGYPPEKQPGLT